MNIGRRSTWAERNLTYCDIWKRLVTSLILSMLKQSGVLFFLWKPISGLHTAWNQRPQPVATLPNVWSCTTPENLRSHPPCRIGYKQSSGSWSGRAHHVKQDQDHVQFNQASELEWSRMHRFVSSNWRWLGSPLAPASCRPTFWRKVLDARSQLRLVTRSPQRTRVHFSQAADTGPCGTGHRLHVVGTSHQLHYSKGKWHES